MCNTNACNDYSRNGSKPVEGIDTISAIFFSSSFFSRNGSKPVEGIDTTLYEIPFATFTV